MDIANLIQNKQRQEEMQRYHQERIGSLGEGQRIQEESERRKGTQDYVDDNLKLGIGAKKRIAVLDKMLEVTERGDISMPMKVATIDAIKEGALGKAIGGGIGAIAGGLLGAGGGTAISGPVGALGGGAAGALAGGSIGAGIGSGLTLDLAGALLTNDTQILTKLVSDYSRLLSQNQVGLSATLIEDFKRAIPKPNQSVKSRRAAIRSLYETDKLEIARSNMINNILEKSPSGRVPTNIQQIVEKKLDSKKEAIKKSVKDYVKIAKQEGLKKKARRREKQKAVYRNRLLLNF